VYNRVWPDGFNDSSDLIGVGQVHGFGFKQVSCASVIQVGGCTHHIVTCLQQLAGHVMPAESLATGYKYTHVNL
jgi:exosortase/archaeosortase